MRKRRVYRELVNKVFISNFKGLITRPYAMISFLILLTKHEHLLRFSSHIQYVFGLRLVGVKTVPIQAYIGHEGSRTLRRSAYRRWQPCQPYAPAAFTLKEDTWYSFCQRLNRPQGYSAAGRTSSSSSSSSSSSYFNCVFLFWFIG